MKPVKTTIWADFTIRDIKVATTRIKPAYIKPQESLPKKHRISVNAMTQLLHLLTKQMALKVCDLSRMSFKGGNF